MESSAQAMDAAAIGGRRPSDVVLGLLLRYGLYVVFLVMCAAVALSTPVFLTSENLNNVLLQSAGVGVIAVGMTFVIIARGIDVSVGAAIGLSSAVGARLMVGEGMPVLVGVLAILATGVAVGLVNGFSSSYLGMPSFLVTLATLTMAEGLALTISGGGSISGLPEAFFDFGTSKVGPIPTPVIVMAAVFVAGHLVLSKTVFGRQVYAVGGNPEAARVAGIRVNRIILATFALAGLAVGIAAVILTARFNSYSGSLGQGYEFTAIAAVVIGGTSLYGGRGTMAGTLIGVLMLGVINNSLNLLGVSPFYQDVVRGGIIFLAVLLDALRTRYEARFLGT
jgi:ribose/xylose/arabinose/galactoside ABC-type transport system permease subunit